MKTDLRDARTLAEACRRGAYRPAIGPLLAVFVVDRQVAWLDSRLPQLAKSDATVERLCTAPRVGPVTAAAYSSTVDDVNRFKNTHQLEAYLGLTRVNGAPADRSRALLLVRLTATRMNREVQVI